MQETNYLRFHVNTFDGKNHEVTVYKSGKSWKASAQVGADHIEGQARTPEIAIDNWKAAYRRKFDF